MAIKLNIAAPMKNIPAEKNHAGFKVITPKIANKKTARKNDVKSLRRAFCAVLDRSFNTKPKLAAAFTGVKIHSSNDPRIK